MEQKTIISNVEHQVNANIYEVLQNSPIKDEGRSVTFPINDQLRAVGTSKKYIYFEKGERDSEEEVRYFLVHHIFVIFCRYGICEQGNKTSNNFLKLNFSDVEKIIKDSINILKNYLNDERQFNNFNLIKPNAKTDVQGIHFAFILGILVTYVGTLNEANYIEEALSITKLIRPFLHNLFQTLDRMKQDVGGKVVKFIVRYRKNLDELFLMLLKETAYCHFQLGDFIAAGLASAEAKHVAEKCYVNKASTIKTKYDIVFFSLLTLYHINENDTHYAQKILDEAITIYSKYADTSTPIWHVDILMYANEKLATEFFKTNNIKACVKYFQLVQNMLTRIIKFRGDFNPFNRDFKKIAVPKRTLDVETVHFVEWLSLITKKIIFLRKKLFAQNAEQLAQLISNSAVRSFFNKDKAFEFNVDNQQFFIYVEDADVAQKILIVLMKQEVKVRFDAERTRALLITNLTDVNPKIIVNQIANIKLPQKKSSEPHKIIDVKNNNAEPLISQMEPQEYTSSYALIADSYSLYKRNPTQKKKTSDPQTETTLEIEKPLIIPTSVPSSFAWSKHNISSTLVSEQGPVYQLSNPPYIPEGHWYAMLNEDKLQKEIDSELMIALKNILARGRLTDRGQGVVYAKKELAGTNYLFKIKLLGNSGKGDIRVYGFVADTVTCSDSVKKLIIFDQVKLHSHKKHQLMKAESQLSNNNLD